MNLFVALSMRSWHALEVHVGLMVPPTTVSSYAQLNGLQCMRSTEAASLLAFCAVDVALVIA